MTFAWNSTTDNGMATKYLILDSDGHHKGDLIVRCRNEGIDVYLENMQPFVYWTKADIIKNFYHHKLK